MVVVVGRFLLLVFVLVLEAVVSAVSVPVVVGVGSWW
jgi:hypothetical protein